MPLSTDDIKQTIRERFALLMTAVPAANIFFEQYPEEPATLGGAPWFELYIKIGGINQVGFGSTGQGDRAFRSNSSITIYANTPMGIGTSLCDQLIDAARAIFEGQVFDGAGCHIRVTSTSVPPAAPRNGYLTGTVMFTFWADGFQ